MVLRRQLIRNLGGRLLFEHSLALFGRLLSGYEEASDLVRICVGFIALGLAFCLACDEQALLETTTCLSSIWDRSFAIWMNIATARSEGCPERILRQRNELMIRSQSVLIRLLKRGLNRRRRHHLLIGHEGVLLEGREDIGASCLGPSSLQGPSLLPGDAVGLIRCHEELCTHRGLLGLACRPLLSLKHRRQLGASRRADAVVL